MQDRFFLSMETIDDDGEVFESTTRSFSSEDLNVILDNFAYFLNGCSYTYVEGLEAIKTSSVSSASTAPLQYTLNLGLDDYDPDDISFSFGSA